mmetsp:Transcript_11110/g.12385  ORF Transcript_11110/g.12385 Transcript_11110/m.12385 type:complete len:108 (+) Transcript_11110:465-788(+)
MHLGNTFRWVPSSTLLCRVWSPDDYRINNDNRPCSMKYVLTMTTLYPILTKSIKKYNKNAKMPQIIFIRNDGKQKQNNNEGGIDIPSSLSCTPTLVMGVVVIKKLMM